MVRLVDKTSANRFWAATTAGVVHYGRTDEGLVTDTGLPTNQAFDTRLNLGKGLYSVRSLIADIEALEDIEDVRDYLEQGRRFFRFRGNFYVLRTNGQIWKIDRVDGVIEVTNTGWTIIDLIQFIKDGAGS